MLVAQPLVAFNGTVFAVANERLRRWGTQPLVAFNGIVLAVASGTPYGVGERNLWLLLLGLLCEGSALNLPQGNYFLDLVLRNLWLLGDVRGFSLFFWGD